MSWDLDALLLDFGGTIDAAGIHWGERFFQLYREVGVALPRERFDEVFEVVDGEIQKRTVDHFELQDIVALQVHAHCVRLNIDGEKIQKQVIERAVKSASENIEKNKKVLERCARRLPLGLVSNYHGNLLTVCRGYGLDALFKVIVDSKKVGFEKPDSRIFRIALDGLKARPERAAFVGDSFDSDIVGAKALGLKTVWLRHKTNRVRGDPALVDATVASLSEIETFICSER